MLIASFAEGDQLRVTLLVTNENKPFQNQQSESCTSSRDGRPKVDVLFLMHVMNLKTPKQFIFFETLKVSSNNFHSAQTLISVLSISRSQINHFEIMTLSWGRLAVSGGARRGWAKSISRHTCVSLPCSWYIRMRWG